MTTSPSHYNRTAKALKVIHAMSHLGLDLRIGVIRHYLDSTGFSAPGAHSGGNLYAVLKILQDAKLVERERREVPITNPSRQKNPRVYFYNLTAKGHRASFKDEDHLREELYAGGLRAAPTRKIPPEEYIRSHKATLYLYFMMHTIDRGIDTFNRKRPGRNAKAGPIEFRFRGHHYYDSTQGRYVD